MERPSLFLTGPVIGYVARIGDRAERDCVIVQVLYKCGAIPFVRTNVPQTLMVSNDALVTIVYNRFDLSTVGRNP